MIKFSFFLSNFLFFLEFILAFFFPPKLLSFFYLSRLPVAKTSHPSGSLSLQFSSRAKPTRLPPVPVPLQPFSQDPSFDLLYLDLCSLGLRTSPVNWAGVEVWWEGVSIRLQPLQALLSSHHLISAMFFHFYNIFYPSAKLNSGPRKSLSENSKVWPASYDHCSWLPLAPCHTRLSPSHLASVHATPLCGLPLHPALAAEIFRPLPVELSPCLIPVSGQALWELPRPLLLVPPLHTACESCTCPQAFPSCNVSSRKPR